ncbi:MAG: AEC family transporter [Thermotogae bacterium]|nr:AEC family transporter [Thermotogota bacterium]
MQEDYLLVVAKVLPIFVMIIIGYILRKINFFDRRGNVINSLKKLVVNLGLPSLLFTAFANVSFKSKYLLLFGLMFGICILLLLIGKMLKKPLRFESDYFPMLMTGFEAGMIGYSLYTVAFGIENLYEFALIDFGHIIFIFSVFVASMVKLAERDKNPSFLLSLIKSPPIIGVLGGIVVGSLGVFENMEGNYFTQAIYQTFKYLGAIVVPLICLIIGYDIKFSKQSTGSAIKVVIIRLFISIALAIFAGEILLVKVFKFDKTFERALITMMILPPPFIMPLFIKEENQKDMQFVLNTLSLHTLISLIVFTVIFSVFFTF